VSEQPTYLESARLPRRPGRPRKAVSGHVVGMSDAGGIDSSGHNGRAVAQEASAPPSPTAAEKRDQRRERALAAIHPRLLDVPAAAAYLSVPEATVYDLAARGVLRRVRVPLPDGSELRKLLFDRSDVDRLIDGWKE
jgi:excisionase family DNA binding protein